MHARETEDPRTGQPIFAQPLAQSLAQPHTYTLMMIMIELGDWVKWEPTK